MSKVIETTPDYTLQVGTTYEAQDRNCYIILNKANNVVEVETFILPQAYEYLEQLQASLDVKRQALHDLKVAAKSEVIRPAFDH